MIAFPWPMRTPVGSYGSMILTRSVRFLPPAGLNSIFAVPFASAVTSPFSSTRASFGLFDVNLPVSPSFTAICSVSSTFICAVALLPVSATVCTAAGCWSSGDGASPSGSSAAIGAAATACASTGCASSGAAMLASASVDCASSGAAGASSAYSPTYISSAYRSISPSSSATPTADSSSATAVTSDKQRKRFIQNPPFQNTRRGRHLIDPRSFQSCQWR